MNFTNQQQYANAWQQGNYNQIPHQEAWQNYNQFAQQASPQELEQAHEQVYAQMPPEQRGGLLQNLLGGLTQRGFSPQQAGVQNTDPYSMSPAEAARVTSYAQQKDPDLLKQIFGPGGALSSPLAKIAVAGVAAYAANRFLGGQSRQGNPLGGAFGGNNNNNNHGGLL
jgi:hypothetical protein